MVHVQVTGKFYVEDDDGPRALVGSLGSDGSVSYDAEARIGELRLERTLEAETAAAVEEVVRAVKSALAAVGIGSGDLFELGIGAEELVGIGGNLHKRGPLIEAKAAAQRREELLKS